MDKYELISSSPDIMETLVKKFWKKVNKKRDCWIWTGTVCSNYGSVYVPKQKGMNVYAHRLSLFISSGKWCPKDKIVCHKCNNKLCVNPAHLYLGDNTTNAKDREKEYNLKPQCKCGRNHK